MLEYVFACPQPLFFPVAPNKVIEIRFTLNLIFSLFMLCVTFSLYFSFFPSLHRFVSLVLYLPFLQLSSLLHFILWCGTFHIHHLYFLNGFSRFLILNIIFACLFRLFVYLPIVTFN